MKPIILTDASCDLPLKFFEENNVPYLGLMYSFKGLDYEDDFGRTISHKEFYDGIRNGEMPVTSQINEFRFIEKFNELLKFNRPIIYIGMSSGLSGTFNSALLARDVILNENKDAEIYIVDTKCASLGEGILVYNAVKMRDNGCSSKEIIEWLENNKNLMNHWFAVEDLNHLKRGGRISSASAAIGEIFDIKPIITMTDEGTLKNITNARGKKKALRILADKFRENASDFEGVAGISHGDCIEDAFLLRDILLKDYNSLEIIINYLGAGLGSHCGSGMVSLCFTGNKK
ncbi:MAG: DegV family protein [Solirubrobacterales bacterium]